jgi:hypothetical protein
MLDDGDAPLAAKIGPLPEHFLLEVIGEAVRRHANKIARVSTARMRWLTGYSPANRFLTNYGSQRRFHPFVYDDASRLPRPILQPLG